MSAADDNKNHQCIGSSEEITSNKNECTSCEQNNVENITEGINSTILDDMSTCAACGKEGNRDNMNTCNKCKSVKYCNAACKKKHRSKHKKACDRRVAELHDEKLFKEVDPEECPICFLPLPLETKTSCFKSCCGKRICVGCLYAMKVSEGKDLCAFCRTPPASSFEEEIERTKKLMEKENGGAFSFLAGCYEDGNGLPQDYQKALELFLKAGELGCATAYFNLGNSYYNGTGVEVDKRKAKHYFELAAMNGNIKARHNLGCLEGQAGNHDRAIKLFVMAARAGDKTSMDMVMKGFKAGVITKDEYADTLRAFHKRQKEMKSDDRDSAAAYSAAFRSLGHN